MCDHLGDVGRRCPNCGLEPDVSDRERLGQALRDDFPWLVKLVDRLNAWLERHQDAGWYRRLDQVGTVLDRMLAVAWRATFFLFAAIGAGIAGYALTRGWAGVPFAIPVAIGAVMVFHYRPKGDE